MPIPNVRPPLPASQPRRPCLLLVDDTPTNIDILVALLKPDYTLKIATHGEKALRICEMDSGVDLVLLDVMMPGMDGFEVCRRLRDTPATRELPILFLTAKSEADDILDGFAAGGNDYLTKPFHPQELRARVRTHLALRSQQLEIERKNEELKELLHVLCHDVANQFMGLSMSLEFVEPDSLATLKDMLPYMKVAVKNGIELTETVRNLRRSEDRYIDLSTVPLREALDESLLLLQAKIQAKNLSIALEAPDIGVIAERCTLINSVFNNILTNAIKYSQPGARIDICATREGPEMRIRFRDHGIGMPAPLVEHLFDVAKTQSRPGTAGERGTGFGMPIMHRFVTRFGGRIEVSSREASSHPDNPGTEMTVWLRLAST